MDEHQERQVERALEAQARAAVAACAAAAQVAWQDLASGGDLAALAGMGRAAEKAEQAKELLSQLAKQKTARMVRPREYSMGQPTDWWKAWLEK